MSMFSFGGSGEPGQSGMEMALRSMGLGSVLDAAKHLAENGAVLKIIKFADDAGELNARLARIEANQIAVMAQMGLEPASQSEPANGGPVLIEGTAIRGADAEPGSGARLGGTG